MSSVTLDWLKGQGQQRANGVIDALSTFEAERLGYDWDFLARPDQLPPAGNWSVWLYLAGRGSGKTRAGVEWVRRKIKQGSRRIALIAPTTSAARDVLIEGESGILAHAWEHDRDFTPTRPMEPPEKPVTANLQALMVTRLGVPYDPDRNNRYWRCCRVLWQHVCGYRERRVRKKERQDRRTGQRAGEEGRNAGTAD
jgi:hypothetical protein